MRHLKRSRNLQPSEELFGFCRIKTGSGHLPNEQKLIPNHEVPLSQIALSLYYVVPNAQVQHRSAWVLWGILKLN